MNNPRDCIIVGGGAAGLSAALVLGRARRRTLLVDAGEQSNRMAEGIGGLLGYDRRPPEALYRAGRDELAAYPSVEVRGGHVVGAIDRGGTFDLELDDGSRERARRVLLATGMDYRFPEVPGVAQRWGRSVFHCPFCHGWEVRDRPLGVLDRGALAVQRALLLRFWSDDVTLLTNGAADLGSGDLDRLQRAGVVLEERVVGALRGPGSTLEAVAFTDGSERRCEGLLLAVTLYQRSTLATQLGARIAEPGPVVAEAVAIDTMFRTSIPGLFAAGDVGTQSPSVATAVAAGSTAAAAVVHDLLAEAYAFGPLAPPAGTPYR